MAAAHVASRELFGTTPAGSPIDLITIANSRGAELQVLTLGAVIRSLRMPDRRGVFDDLVLGFDNAHGYAADRCFIGGTIGRYANRIACGRFVLDGRMHELPRNDGGHHLHGGPTGFHTMLWSAEVVESSVRLARRSPDGEQGYPGNLDVEIIYTLTDDQELIVEYRATTDRATPINLTQHSYFNLRGAGRGTIHEHELHIAALGYLPVDRTAIPAEHIQPVANTPFDFAEPRAIGPRMGALEPQRGFDHCFVLRRKDRELHPAALLFEPHTGRTLEVLTTEPGLQLYTGQFLEPTVGKDGRSYGPYSGLCLETQHFPNSPNRPEFPSVILRPGEQFYSKTVFRFGVRA